MAGVGPGPPRAPLGDATRRVNNSAPTMSLKPPNIHGSEAVLHRPQPLPPPPPGPSRQRHRVSAIRERTEFESKRASQISQDSAASGRSKEGYKRFVGPWQLGKTLGKGSSARVRLCRHRYTQQSAAVKIVNKRMAYMIPDTSLAALNKWDTGLPEKINGELRVPMAIEREVAILKLIDHPNIMKLYDIWENRSEIYLILEYVDGGDLFTFIVENTPLSEEIVMGFFRQIMSAISFCHSSNICHRDLKPENILITKRGQIKIADFGMAALHQTDDHRLATWCGSPHYAAPELLRMKQYRGDKADIWSLGVILYAMLTSNLPFDDPNFDVMVEKTKKGNFYMPEFISPEAKDLIQRMIKVNPNRRISLRDMWNHPLICKYNYLDNFGSNHGQPPGLAREFQNVPVPAHQVDSQLLRQLRSMYHMFTDEQLKIKLSSEESNDQKVFYWLLYNYREKQLEDFSPELSHSVSDYHHLKPSAWKKRVSTCAFSQPRTNGHGRSVSRFTVISNVAESEAETIQSYDPFKASRNLHPRGSQASRSKVIVHSHVLDATTEEPGSTGSQMVRRDTVSSYRRKRMGSQRASPSIRQQSPRTSMSSLQSSRQGTPYSRAVAVRKRGIDFSHIRRQSAERQRERALDDRRVGPCDTISDSTPHPREGKGPSPRKRQREEKKLRPVTLNVLKPKDPYQTIREDLQNFATDIAKDCDEAFNSSLIGEVSFSQSIADASQAKRQSTPMSFDLASTFSTTSNLYLSKPWDSRPLPPLPQEPIPPSQSTMQFKSQTEGGLGIHNLLPTRTQDRRVASAPAPNRVYAQSAHLPTMNEGIRERLSYLPQEEFERPRVVSAPPRQDEPFSVNGRTIRIVDSPFTQSPVKAPKPLNIWKKKAEDAINPDPSSTFQKIPPDDGGTAHASGDFTSGKRRLSSWFRRSSKSHLMGDMAVQADNVKSDQVAENGQQQTDSVSTLKSVSTKKKAFGFLFWKSKEIPKMSIEYSPKEDSPSPDIPQEETKKGRVSRLSYRESGSETRNIEVKQNWLARLFRVKPARSYLCFNISRKRARQEVAIILREWRKYGMRDVQVDKERNLIFARVGSPNYLELKDVSFAAEIMTVVEHGKRNPLSIVRLTQERGAASSFHKVVDTMRIVFESRGLLVKDRRKVKMMVKTLNS